MPPVCGQFCEQNFKRAEKCDNNMFQLTELSDSSKGPSSELLRYVAASKSTEEIAKNAQKISKFITEHVLPWKLADTLRRVNHEEFNGS